MLNHAWGTGFTGAVVIAYAQHRFELPREGASMLGSNALTIRRNPRLRLRLSLFTIQLGLLIQLGLA
jgi:hypothetical protein